MALHKGISWLADDFEKGDRSAAKQKETIILASSVNGSSNSNEQTSIGQTSQNRLSLPTTTITAQFDGSARARHGTYVRPRAASAGSSRIEERRINRCRSAQSSVRSKGSTYSRPHSARAKLPSQNPNSGRITYPVIPRTGGWSKTVHRGASPFSTSLREKRNSSQTPSNYMPAHPDLRYFDRHSRCYNHSHVAAELLPHRPRSACADKRSSLQQCQCCGEVTSKIRYKYASTGSAMTAMTPNKTFLYPDKIINTQDENRRPSSAPPPHSQCGEDYKRDRELPMQNYVIRGDVPHFCNFIRPCKMFDKITDEPIVGDADTFSGYPYGNEEMYHSPFYEQRSYQVTGHLSLCELPISCRRSCSVVSITQSLPSFLTCLSHERTTPIHCNPHRRLLQMIEVENMRQEMNKSFDEIMNAVQVDMSLSLSDLLRVPTTPAKQVISGESSVHMQLLKSTSLEQKHHPTSHSAFTSLGPDSAPAGADFKPPNLGSSADVVNLSPDNIGVPQNQTNYQTPCPSDNGGSVQQQLPQSCNHSYHQQKHLNHLAHFQHSAVTDQLYNQLYDNSQMYTQNPPEDSPHLGDFEKSSTLDQTCEQSEGSLKNILNCQLPRGSSVISEPQSNSPSYCRTHISNQIPPVTNQFLNTKTPLPPIIVHQPPFDDTNRSSVRQQDQQETFSALSSTSVPINGIPTMKFSPLNTADGKSPLQSHQCPSPSELLIFHRPGDGLRKPSETKRLSFASSLLSNRSLITRVILKRGSDNVKSSPQAKTPPTSNRKPLQPALSTRGGIYSTSSWHPNIVLHPTGNQISSLDGSYRPRSLLDQPDLKPILGRVKSGVTAVDSLNIANEFNLRTLRSSKTRRRMVAKPSAHSKLEPMKTKDQSKMLVQFDNSVPHKTHTSNSRNQSPDSSTGSTDTTMQSTLNHPDILSVQNKVKKKSKRTKLKHQNIAFAPSYQTSEQGLSVDVVCSKKISVEPTIIPSLHLVKSAASEKPTLVADRWSDTSSSASYDRSMIGGKKLSVLRTELLTSQDHAVQKICSDNVLYVKKPTPTSAASKSVQLPVIKVLCVPDTNETVMINENTFSKSSAVMPDMPEVWSSFSSERCASRVAIKSSNSHRKSLPDASAALSLVKVASSSSKSVPSLAKPSKVIAKSSQCQRVSPGAQSTCSMVKVVSSSFTPVPTLNSPPPQSDISNTEERSMPTDQKGLIDDNETLMTSAEEKELVESLVNLDTRAVAKTEKQLLKYLDKKETFDHDATSLVTEEAPLTSQRVRRKSDPKPLKMISVEDIYAKSQIMDTPSSAPAAPSEQLLNKYSESKAPSASHEETEPVMPSQSATTLDESTAQPAYIPKVSFGSMDAASVSPPEKPTTISVERKRVPGLVRKSKSKTGKLAKADKKVETVVEMVEINPAAVAKMEAVPSPRAASVMDAISPVPSRACTIRDRDSTKMLESRPISAEPKENLCRPSVVLHSAEAMKQSYDLFDSEERLNMEMRQRREGNWSKFSAVHVDSSVTNAGLADKIKPINKRPQLKMQAWMHGRLALSKRSSRFELPIDMRLMETMTPLEYLNKYCVVTSRRQLLYDKIYMKNKDGRTGKLTYSDLQRALSDVLIHSIDDSKMKIVIELLGITEDISIERKLFSGIAAFAERLLYPIFARGVDQSANETQKERIEYADFYALSWKFNGVQVNNNIRKVLEVL